MSTTAASSAEWDEIRLEIAAAMSVDQYETWIAPLRARLEGEDTYLIYAPNDFAAIWLEDNYLDLIREKVTAALGSEIEILIQTVETAAPPPPRSRVEGQEPTRRLSEKVAAARAESARPKKRKIYLNPRNTFDNFIVGPSNQLAHAAATAVAAEPGKAYNPLFVYGDTGLGKTHLMHSIAHAIQQNDPQAHVVYISCEKFTSKFLAAIRENTMRDFRRLFRKVDVLLIDDVQFLEGKERTQEEFFHTFNELFESQRQLCLSSDRPPSEISKLEARLVSRFQWGMVTDVQSPDLETRVAILKKKTQAMGHQQLPEDILYFLAQRITRNVRRMEGALIKVATYTKLVHQKIDIATTERLIHDILQEEAQQQISIERVQKKVVEFFDLKMSDMTSKRRPSNIAFPRQIAMYLSRLLTNLPLKEIGEAFGGRDHGTVIHACKTVENIMEQDERMRRNIEHITKQITGQAL